MPTPHEPVRPGDAHAAVKHELLVRYLDAWTPTVLHAARRVSYAEGQAGSALRAGQDPPSLAALRVFGEFIDRLSGRTLAMVLVENDPGRLDDLAGRLATAYRELGSPPELSLHTVQGSCAAGLVPALTETGAFGGPIFAYLDAADAPLPAFEVVSAIGRHRSSEALITLDPATLVELAAGERAPEAGDDFFGSRDWRGAADRRSEQRYPYLLACYRQSLRRARLGHALQVELVDDSGQMQLLVFATSSPKNLERLKRDLWAVDEYAGVRYRDPRDGRHELLDISVQPHLGPLRRMLLETVGGHERTVTELREYTLAETIYPTSDASRALSALLATGAVTRRPERGRLAADTIIGAA